MCVSSVGNCVGVLTTFLGVCVAKIIGVVHASLYV